MLKLTEKKISREKAYRIVQKVALKSWNNEQDFKKLLLKDKDIKMVTRMAKQKDCKMFVRPG